MTIGALAPLSSDGLQRSVASSLKPSRAHLDQTLLKRLPSNSRKGLRQLLNFARLPQRRCRPVPLADRFALDQMLLERLADELGAGAAAADQPHAAADQPL